MLLTIIFIFLLIVIIFIFSSSRLSPIPYFPSQPIDLPLIIKALKLRNNQTIIDLGAGDGLVIFASAKQAKKLQLNTQFIAVEINPILLLVMHIRKLFHSNKNNIKIIYGDIFTIKYNKIINFNLINNKNILTFYLYISPWYLKKTIKNIQRQHIKQSNIVSYMYPITSLKNSERVIRGKNKIFQYLIP